MKRKHPLKRSPLKRSRMSRKRRSPYTTPAREQWRQEQTHCSWCGRRLHMPSSQCHEIAGGPHRARSIEVVESLLILCGDSCHRAIEHLDKPSAYAVKAIVDPTHYDRRILNRLHRPNDESGATVETFVTAGEVALALARLVASGRCGAITRRLALQEPEAA